MGFQISKNSANFGSIHQATSSSINLLFLKSAQGLAEFSDVDIYGKCGNQFCPKANHGHDFCFEDLSANHSFYLAFENSNCVDYITEKFWRTLTKPIIPIVMGGALYHQEAQCSKILKKNCSNIFFKRAGRAGLS